jgi:hypothetical protein
MPSALSTLVSGRAPGSPDSNPSFRCGVDNAMAAARMFERNACHQGQHTSGGYLFRFMRIFDHLYSRHIVQKLKKAGKMIEMQDI